MAEQYVLRYVDDRIDGDGETRWVYLSGSSESNRPHLGSLALEPAEKRGWWLLPYKAVPDDIVLVGPPGRLRTLYRRRIVAEGYPDELSALDYDERTDDESGSYDPIVRELYEPVYEETDPSRTPVEGSWLTLDGQPPPDDGRHWTAKLPHELRTAPEYLHLFPGHLEGFREAVSDALNEIDGVTCHNLSGRPGLSVYATVILPKPEPVHWQSKPDHRGLTRAESKRAVASEKSTVSSVTRHLEIPLYSQVSGANRAEAVEQWDATLAEIVEYVRGIIAQPCPHCAGRGWIDSTTTTTMKEKTG